MFIQKKALALVSALIIGVLTLAGLAWVIFDSSLIVKETIKITQKKPISEKERIKELEALQEIDQNSIDAVSELAKLTFANKDYVRAAQEYAELYKLNPADRNALFMSARSHYLAGDLVKSAAIFNQPELDAFADTATYRARFLLDEEKRAEAVNLLIQNLNQFPEHSPSRLLLAETYLLWNKTDQARTVFEKLLENPDKLTAAAAYFGIAQTLQREGKSDEAIAWMKKAPEIAVSMQLDTALAEFWRNLGQPAESRKLYERLLDHYGPQVELIVAYAELLAADEKATMIENQRSKIKSASAYSLAARHYLDALVSYLGKDYSATLQSLRWAETMLGTRELFSLVEMDSAAKLGDKIRFGKSLDRMNLRSLSVNRSQYLQNLLLKHASERLNRGDGEFGELLAETVLKLDNKNDAARLMLSRAYLLLGKNQESLEIATLLISEDKFTDAALEISGRAHIELGHYEQASDSLKRLQAIDIQNPVSHYWLGINHFRQKQYDLAVEPLKKAYDLGAEIKSGAALLDVYLSQKNYPAAIDIAETFKAKPDTSIQALGWAYLAGVAQAQKNFADSAKYYEQAALLDPARPIYKLSALDRYIDAADYERAFLLLADLKKAENYRRIVRFKEAYLQQITGQSDLAIKNYRQLNYDFPDWAIIQVNLSELLAEQTDTVTEALQMARQATELAPDWSAAQLNMARLLAANDKPAEALVYARKALSIDSSLNEAQTLIRKLDKQS